MKLKNLSVEELDAEYKELRNNSLFLQWREKHLINSDWYYGNIFVCDKKKKELEQQGIECINCNLITPIVDALLGVEIQNEYRIKVNVTNMTDDARDFEDGINQYLCVLQNKQEFAQDVRRSLKDCLIGGLGFVRVFYHNHEPSIEYINVLNIIPDFRDSTLTFEKQNTIVTWEDLHENEIKLKYGIKNCKDLVFDKKQWYSPAIKRELPYSLLNNSPDNRVFNFHKKEIVTGWQGEDEDGQIIKTVNEEVAKNLKTATLCSVTVNTNTIVCQGKIIQRNAEEPIVVGGDIPIACMVYRKDAVGRPQGLVEKITSVQEGLNIAFSRLTAYSNTEKIYAFIENVADRELLVNNPDLLVRPNAVVVLTPRDKVETVRPIEAIRDQTQLIQLYTESIKRVSGVEDETRGVPTNAVSGTAQRQRDITSMRTNAFLYDNFKHYKKKIGKLVLQQLQNSFDTDIVVKMLDDQEKENIVLNQVVEKEDGTWQILNDISTQKWNLSIEQAPADSTTKIQQREDLLSLAQTPLAPYIMKSKAWLGLFVSNPAKVMKEIQETTAQEASMAQSQQK